MKIRRFLEQGKSVTRRIIGNVMVPRLRRFIPNKPLRSRMTLRSHMIVRCLHRFIPSPASTVGDKRRAWDSLGADYSVLNLPAGLSTYGVRPAMHKVDGLVSIEIPGGCSDLALDWVVPVGDVIEAHGHCLAIYSPAMKKLGEAFVTSSSPVSLKIVTDTRCQNGSTGETRVVRFTAAAPHEDVTVVFRRDAFLIKERGVASAMSGWRRWEDGDRPVTYLLENPQSEAGRARLLVVFSALGPSYDFTYNYRQAVEGVDAYRLFILDDFGQRGSYYFADHRDQSIYHSVQEFFMKMFDELDIRVEDVTFAGSSKGGTAALIHGLPLGVQNIIVGAPQSRPGTYLKDSAPQILDFIAGESADSKEWLDRAVWALLSKAAPLARVKILVGAADHHLKAHVRPLEKQLIDSGTSVETMVVENLNHQAIGKPFSAFLRASVGFDGKAAAALIPFDLHWSPSETCRAILKLWIPLGETVSVSAYAGEEVIERHAYSGTDEFSFDVPEGQRVRVRIYRRDASSHDHIGAFTTPWLEPSGTV